ncbi:MAG: hypothetical protein CMI08_07545 [Oceanospirillaceae bacterium]|nr:hypothetical protein [Oceanospirillaceae bacterium]MAX99045.1 hypothetical protein [Oceanospirillaceae bacterium]MBS53322.1 hypothetical protein [Oceanospirillaceae bacterium]|tara:strand:+ start:191 stop:448 length:258 start_codon:yes stop_codon:yes gene_type:complete
MHQSTITGVISPITEILATLEPTNLQESQAWLRMTVTERQMIARAANCPESVSLTAWQKLMPSHRVAIRKAAGILFKNIEGLIND